MSWKKIQGQERVVALLREAVRSGHLPPAYLFVGPPGVGKMTTALVLSHQLLGSEKEQHADRLLLVPEKGSIKIEAIRDLIQKVSFRPLEANRMVIIVDESDKMTLGAANALLKVLEEPPSYVLFILLSATPDSLPATIRSRCQKILFRPSAPAEPIESSEEWQHFTQDLLPFFIGPAPFLQVSKQAEEWASDSDQLPQLLKWLRLCWHDLLVLRETGTDQSLLLPDQVPMIRRLAEQRSAGRLSQDFDHINEAERALEANVQKTLALERLFMQLTEGGHMGPPLRSS